MNSEERIIEHLLDLKTDVAGLKQQNVSIVDRLDKINGRVGKSEDRLSDLEIYRASHESDTKHAHEDIAEIKVDLKELKTSVEKDPTVKKSMFGFESVTLLKIGLVIGGVVLAVFSGLEASSVLEFLKSLL